MSKTEMESLSINESGQNEQFHDCSSQPTSPKPKNGSSAGGETVVGSAAVNGDSSKENSPRPQETTNIETVSTVDKKLKRKEDKNMDYVLKALSSLSTPEEKLAALCKKYTDLLDENRQNSSSVKTSTKKLSQVSRERDSLQTENSKLILAKSKLESLCRELQRHNKVVKDESVTRQREEEERRKEVSSRFQTTITDIQTQMEAHSQRNDKLQEDNKELSSKLHTLLEQYEKREEHIQKLLHQKDLETQLLEAKLSQCSLMIEKEQEKGGAEKQMLLEKLIESKTTQETMAQTEMHLKTQLQIYTDKYSEFESTLNKSNEVFAAFKSEMEKMTKKIKKLEKESAMYKQRYENTNRALLEMVEQKTLHEKLIDTQTKKNQKLESLCRALQSRATGDRETGGDNCTTPQPATADVHSNHHCTDEPMTANGEDRQQQSVTAMTPDNCVRPQAIGQSSDEQETASDTTESAASDDMTTNHNTVSDVGESVVKQLETAQVKTEQAQETTSLEKEAEVPGPECTETV